MKCRQEDVTENEGSACCEDQYISVVVPLHGFDKDQSRAILAENCTSMAERTHGPSRVLELVRTSLQPHPIQYLLEFRCMPKATV
jgi:hypothetical protein